MRLSSFVFPCFVTTCVAAMLFLSSFEAHAQSTPKQGSERERAFELYNAGKFVEAMPLLEKLAADQPSDAVVHEHWAYCVAAYAATLNDPDLRKKARIRALAIARQARDLGDNSNLMQMLLAIPEDGSEPSFSPSQDVDAAMKAAEADFARGDFDKARGGYLRAMLLDPHNYFAPLFIGDVYFNQHNYVSAGEWFARAIEINANQETAYRYWGDALWASGKGAEAREKYIEAVIAEPYNRTAWVGISQWADRNHVSLKFLRLKDGSTAKANGNGATITLDSSMLDKKDDITTASWLAYGANRALWQTEKFKKEFPKETAYRHSLKEESESLHVMVNVLSEMSEKDKGKDVDPALLELAKIDQAGLLDPFVLINSADEGIARDYEAYCDTNRETIRRYLDEIVVPQAPSADSQ